MFFTCEKGFKHKEKKARKGEKEFVLVGCFYLEKGVQTIIKCFNLQRKKKTSFSFITCMDAKETRKTKGRLTKY